MLSVHKVLQEPIPWLETEIETNNRTCQKEDEMHNLQSIKHKTIETQERSKNAKQLFSNLHCGFQSGQRLDLSTLAVIITKVHLTP